MLLSFLVLDDEPLSEEVDDEVELSEDDEVLLAPSPFDDELEDDEPDRLSFL